MSPVLSDRKIAHLSYGRRLLRCRDFDPTYVAVETTKVISRVHSLRPSPLRPFKRISAAIVFSYGH
jgi:hypothetical protein